jgi:hypothetical protein
MVAVETPVQLKTIKPSTPDGVINNLTRTAVTEFFHNDPKNNHTYPVFKTTNAKAENTPTTAKPAFIDPNAPQPKQALNTSVEPTTLLTSTRAQLSTGKGKIIMLL